MASLLSHIKQIGAGRSPWSAEESPYARLAGIEQGANPYATSRDGDNRPDQTNPMAAVVDSIRNSGQPLTLDTIVQAAQSQGLTAVQIANLQGLNNLQGITFTSSGLDALAQANGGQSLDVNVSGSDISGATFHPESCFDAILIDEVTVGAEAEILTDAKTKMQFMQLKDFTQQADINLKGDVSFLSIDGTRDQGAKQPNISIEEGTVARGMDMEGAKLAKVEVGKGSDLTGLKAKGSGAIEIKADGVILNGADFSDSSVSEKSSITNSELVGARFDNVAAMGLDVSGSNLVGTSWQNVEMANVTLNGATIREKDFIGAKYDGTTITEENVGEMVAQLRIGGKAEGLKLASPETDMTLTTEKGSRVILPADEAVNRVGRSLDTLEQQRNAGPQMPAKQADTSPPEAGKQANIELNETDALIAALTAAVASGRKVGGMQDAAAEIDSVNPALAQYQREHDVPSRHV